MMQKFRNLISVIVGLCVLSTVLVPAGALTVTPVTTNNVYATSDSVIPINLSDESFEVCIAEGIEFGEAEFAFFPSDLLEDEYYKDIFEKIMTDYKEDVEKQDGGIILKGKALEAFDKLCYDRELKEGIELPAEMFAEDPFKEIFESVKKDYPAFVEEKDGIVILREKALEAFDQKCSEIEFPEMGIAFDSPDSAFFPSEMLEDELFKDIFEKIMTDHKEDVEKQEDGVVLRGKALESFDEEFFKIEVPEMGIAFDSPDSAFFPSEMLEDEFFKDIFEKIMTDHKEDVEKQEDGVVLRGKALEAFDEEFFKIENESGSIAISLGEVSCFSTVKK